MASKKEIALHNAAVEYKVFLDSLYYPGVNGKDFEAVRNRFYQLFTPLLAVSKQTLPKPCLECSIENKEGCWKAEKGNCDKLDQKERFVVDEESGGKQ